MSFSYDNFIRPLTTSDRVLKIYGDDGIVVYTINPFSVKTISVYANNIRVNLHTDRLITINFSSNNEAKMAIGKLRTALDVLQNKEPLFISKEIQEYVKNNVFGPTGATGSTGNQGPQGDVGNSAYEVWLELGNVGTPDRFFQSLSGSSGSAGTAGTSGTTGTAGTSGTSGLADRYNGTSSNQIVIPSQGTVVSFDTQTELAFVPGQHIYLYNDLSTNFYLIDDYVEDLTSVYILGEVDSYDRVTGSMSIVTIESQPIGGTYSTWYLALTGQRGQMGLTGSNGTQGTSGIDGTSGTSGIDGTSGFSGTSGTSGAQGPVGPQGQSSNLFYYKGSTSSISGNPGAGYLTWDSYGQTSSTSLNINMLEEDGTDIDIFLSLIIVGQQLVIQDRDLSDNYQKWEVSSTPTKVVDTTNYWIVPVVLTEAAGEGFTNFADNDQLFLGIFNASGTSGTSGVDGSIGTSGTSGTTPTVDLTLSGNLNVSGTSSFNGLSVLAETSEVLNSYGATASNVTYDFNTGAIWYHGTASTNYTANFTNLPTTNNRAITATIMINQGATGYSPTIVKIDGATQSVKWSGGTYSVSANKVDVVGFTFIRTGSVWAQVFGQISSFS